MQAETHATGSRVVSTPGTMQRFTQLKVWQLAHAWVLDVYRLSARFPADERFGLTSQLRKSASSVPANIAEGSRRATNIDYGRFLNNSQSSLSEAEYHLILARDLEYAERRSFEALLVRAAEIGRMLHGLRERVLGTT